MKSDIRDRKDLSDFKITIDEYLNTLLEYDKLIDLFINEFQKYIKKSKLFLSSICAKKYNNYYRFYRVCFNSLSTGDKNYFFKIIPENEIGHALRSAEHAQNKQYVHLAKSLIEIVRDRNSVYLEMSMFCKSYNRRKLKINLLKEELGKLLEV